MIIHKLLSLSLTHIQTAFKTSSGRLGKDNMDSYAAQDMVQEQTSVVSYVVDMLQNLPQVSNLSLFPPSY